jgi:AhpD family alkylhydroperoxidase
MTDTATAGRTPRLTPQAGSPDVVAGIQQIVRSIYASGLSPETLELVHMRASQINGCDACIASGIKNAERNGIGLERLLALPAWRHSALFDDAERSAVALAEAMTRLPDRPDAVGDDIWDEVSRHFDERALSALVSWIALTNYFNRINTTLRIPPGTWD